MKKHAKKIIISLISVAILIVAWVAWLAIPGDTTELESVANKFQPNPSWGLANKHIYPAYKICLSGTCETANYSWRTSENIGSEDLLYQANLSGYNLASDDDCESREDYICPLTGSEDGYRVIIYGFPRREDREYSSIDLTVYKIK